MRIIQNFKRIPGKFKIFNFVKLLMRFLFCGGIDCPEWFLAQSVVLNQISTVKLLLITKDYIN